MNNENLATIKEEMLDAVSGGGGGSYGHSSHGGIIGGALGLVGGVIGGALGLVGGLLSGLGGLLGGKNHSHY
jgi:hypothetical protein